MTLARLSDNGFPSFPSFFNRFLEGDMMDWSNSNFAGSNSTLPAVNIKENENQFEIEVAAPISDNALQQLADGVDLDSKTTRPAQIRRRSAKRFQMVLKEGRNRQIRRMVNEVGNRVVRLKRIRVANIRLGGLSEGCWRPLSEKEKQSLLKML